MNVNTALRRRKLGLPGRIELDFAFDRIRLKEAVKLAARPNQDDQDLKTYGPLACVKIDAKTIAVANEDGYVNLLRTERLESKAHWMAHENAIFDIKANPDQSSIFTASGDTTIKQWDLETKKQVNSIVAHYSSIKSISIYDKNVLASGSRDGSIKIHDLRIKPATVLMIRDAHRNQIIGKTRKVTAKTDPVSCVTNVVFDQYCPRIYSTGANDATIKLWDLRRISQTNRVKRTADGQIVFNQPFTSIHHPSKGVHCGYSHLVLSSGKIYAACSDNKIYCYDRFLPETEPIKFTGYRYDTYLKLAIMEDRFLLSGAKGGGAIIWSLGNKQSSKYYPETTKQPFGHLKPDDIDRFDTNVVETDWETLSIFTFRDDHLVCKWTMQHVLESEKKRLASQTALASQQDDVTIEMSDIIDVNVLRPNHRLSNVQAITL